VISLRQSGWTAALAIAASTAGLTAQVSGVEGVLTPGQAQRAALTDYEGIYEYQGGTKLVIVGAEPLLFGVLDDAKYPLRPLGVDTFQNAGGDTIPFRRSADGSVSGFVERGVFFARLSRAVDPEIAAAVRATPRPVGPDGRALPYEYRRPADLGDGLAVGEVAQAGLDHAVATRLVDRVVDGTYKDVHGILVYRGGRLVIEEYFYEYDRDRVHQMRSASKSVRLHARRHCHRSRRPGRRRRARVEASPLRVLRECRPAESPADAAGSADDALGARVQRLGWQLARQ
jgi:hypothetical protein